MFEANQIDSVKKLNYSTESDSSNIKKTDSIKLFTPLKIHGSIIIGTEENNNSYAIIKKSDIVYDNYSTLEDEVLSRVPAFPIYLGSRLNNNNFLIMGSNSHSNSLGFNGRPILELFTNNYNLSEYPVEFMDEAEVFIGSDAVINSNSSSGSYINIKEINYNTRLPYTRLWFHQGGNDLLGADGIISQNISQNINTTFGFRRLGESGRSANNWTDNWNVRGLIRINLGDRTSVSFSDIFTNMGLGTNGGIDNIRSSDIYDDLASQVRFNDLNERVFRHDLTLSFISQSIEDTTRFLSANLFYSNEKFERNIDSKLFNPNDSIQNFKYGGFYSGASCRFTTGEWAGISMIGGGELIYSNSDSSRFNDSFKGISGSFFSRGAMNFSSIELSGGIRYFYNYNRSALNFGVKLKTIFSKNYNFIFDFSHSIRFPSLSEGLHLNSEKIELFYSELNGKIWNYDFKIGAFYRLTSSFIESVPIYSSDSNFYLIGSYSTNTNKLETWGAYFETSSEIIPHIFASINLLSNYTLRNSKKYELLPFFYSQIRAFYEIHRGRSILRLGFETGFITNSYLLSYIEPTRTFVDLNENLTKNLYSGINLFAAARLGSAYVKLTYENILSQKYYYVPFYPMNAANLRLTATIHFFD